MINTKERLAAAMMGMAPTHVRAAIRVWGNFVVKQMKDRRQYLQENGFEEVDVASLTGEYLTRDGRAVLWSAARAWALKPEVHAERLKAAMAQEKQRDAITASRRNSDQPATCTSLIDGQLCGGSLSASPVCPKCALGKQGVAQIMTCDVCGAQTAVMR